MAKIFLGSDIIDNFKINLNITENYKNCSLFKLSNDEGEVFSREDRIPAGTYKIEIEPASNYQIDSISLDGSPFNNGDSITINWEQDNFNFDIIATRLNGFKASVSNLGDIDISKVTFNVEENFPFDFEEVTIHSDVTGDDNTFIKIPIMYRRIDKTSGNQITDFTISTKKDSDDFIPYPCFVTSDNKILPYILIGKYFTSNSKASSIDSYASVVPATARTYVKQLGTGYHLYDWQVDRLMADLVIMYFREIRGLYVPSQVDLFGINNLTNCNFFIDGISKYDSNNLIVAYNPDNYISYPSSGSTGYSTLNYNYPTPSNTSDVQITTLGYDTNNPFVNMPASSYASDNKYSTYYCSALKYYSGTYPIIRGIHLNNNNNGIYATYSYNSWAWGSSFYIRICYRPLELAE